MVEHQRYNSCHFRKGVSEIMKYQTQTTLNKWAHILVKRKEKNELIKCESSYIYDERRQMNTRSNTVFK
jgi:hypothetical protein